MLSRVFPSTWDEAKRRVEREKKRLLREEKKLKKENSEQQID